MILLFTPNSLEPFHPKMKMNKEILEENGYKIRIYNLNSNTKWTKINYFSLGFFNILAFFKSIHYILKYKKETKIIYVTDLQYLPIAILGKIFKKKVIYETLDNNVEVYFYSLSKKYKIINKFNFLKSIFFFLEKFLSKYFCDEIIVNSKALNEYFLPLKTNIIYYSSPFENKFLIKYTNKKIVFLYLGTFSKNKGANEILDFIEQYKIVGYIFGDIIENDIRDKMNYLVEKNLLIYSNRISTDKLENNLKNIFNEYRVIGFSLIKSVHYSYATQEANKDIDYLAMGIPFIGNYRIPTKEKIENKCGVFYDKKKEIKNLINNQEFYKRLSLNSLEYYKKNYSQKIYENKLTSIIKELLK